MEGEENQEDAPAKDQEPPPEGSPRTEEGLLSHEPMAETHTTEPDIPPTELAEQQPLQSSPEGITPTAIEGPKQPPPHSQEKINPLPAERSSEKPPPPLEMQSSSAEPEGRTDLSAMKFDPDSSYKGTPQTEIELAEKGGVKNFSGGVDGVAGVPEFATFHCPFTKRSPFIHNPPQPEIRRTRIDHPRTPREYIINLREDLADFQESHGLPRSRDYTFVSLGLALAQETARTICSLFLMFAELFPILAIVSLILRFALDKLIEIMETSEPVPKLKKVVIFAVEMLAILIPLYILIGTIIIPLIALIFSIFKRMVRIKGGSCPGKSKSKPTCRSIDLCRFLY